MGSEEASVSALVRRIHGSPVRVCLVVAGAGSRALAWILGEAGASRTVLDAQIPYSPPSLESYTGRKAEQHVSVEEAVIMAGVACRKAREFAGDAGAVVAGISCTATIATDRPKRGNHRVHVAWCREGHIRCFSLVLSKGARDRNGEEEVVSRLVLMALAEACGVEFDIDIELLNNERVEVADRQVDEPA